MAYSRTMDLLSLFRRLTGRRPATWGLHTLVCGASRSGKSEAELARLVPLARAGGCAVVLLDPPGTLAAKFLLHLESLGLTGRVLYDRLADTDRVPGYDWLTASDNPDPLQREAENDERVREFASVLLRRRGIQDPAGTPLIEEGLLAALRLYLHQRTRVPLPWLADAFDLGSPTRARLLANCTEPDLVRKFHEYAALSPTARRAETAPAERILRAVCLSPAFRIRSGDATVDLDRFLDGKGILILDGSSRGNLSRDASAVMMGAVVLRVIRHCRTGAKSRVVLVLDEAVNAGLVGPYESRALAEAGKWGLDFHILVQDPFGFPTEEVRRNVLQNCWRHEWFRQGSPEAARLAADDIATPLLDPLKLHHTEYHTRTIDTGFDRVRTESRSAWADPSGHVRGRSTSWTTALWPHRREVKHAQERYTTLQDQILLLQKELMLLRPGYRFIRADAVTSAPEYVRMLVTPWPVWDGEKRTTGRVDTQGLTEAKLRRVLAALKRHPGFRTPGEEPSPAPPDAQELGAARTLATRARD